jgi:hypothetical protein
MQEAVNIRTAGAGPLTEEAQRRILEAISAISYGSVEIVIHDSRIVQIERREKVRFELQSDRVPKS